MNRFLQLHLLTSYPPANLNRDDLGRPKTAVMGGALRLRVSSQSLKRAWRTSELFESALKGFVGTRTRRIGLEWILPSLKEKGLSDEQVALWSSDIQKIFGEQEDQDRDNEESKKHYLNKQLAHIAPLEGKILREFIDDIGKLLSGNLTSNSLNLDILEDIKQLQDEREKKKKADDKKKITNKIIGLLRKHILSASHGATDIALFGRMLASSPAYNTEAAAQVAHAISVHKVQIEDDFFTAVDDLNEGIEDVGAGHMGETEFGAGVFYLYVCIDRALLLENLNNDADLYRRTLAALIECAATIAPTGKQNSFASRARASYVLAEKGNQQPRSLSVAFLKPVTGDDMLNSAIQRLEDKRDKMDVVYGACVESRYAMNAETGEGTLQGLIEFTGAE